MFRLGSRGSSWAGTLALVSLVVLLASGCGGSRAQTVSGGGASARSGRLSTAAGTKVAVNAWVGHLVSYDAVDPTTIGKVETGFPLQADQAFLSYDRSTGAAENQSQPTGRVAWVAIPPESPTLAEVARIETTFKPAPGSSASSTSADTLVLLERKSIRARWLITAWLNLENPSQTTLNEVRSVGRPLSSAAAAKLPISPQELPGAYENYISGGDSPKFAPGQFTDQARNAFESSQASWAAEGASVTTQYSQGSARPAYSLKGGDALVFFGVVSSNVYKANPSTCLRQSATTPNFPPVVPDGSYQSVTVQAMESALAIEDPHSGMVSIIGASLYLPVKATTTPTTAPACL